MIKFMDSTRLEEQPKKQHGKVLLSKKWTIIFKKLPLKQL
jgi:hypothetical protein